MCVSEDRGLPIAHDSDVVLTTVFVLRGADAGPALPCRHSETAGISSGHARITAERALPAALLRLSGRVRLRAG
jgi:hypothetical protein